MGEKKICSLQCRQALASCAAANTSADDQLIAASGEERNHHEK
jgi:hypothetical protein